MFIYGMIIFSLIPTLVYLKCTVKSYMQIRSVVVQEIFAIHKLISTRPKTESSFFEIAEKSKMQIMFKHFVDIFF